MAELHLHFDPFSGISGDMTLGALLDLGLELGLLRSELGKLGISGYRLASERVNRNGISAVLCTVHSEEARAHRHLQHIDRIIRESQLEPWIQEKSLQAFTRLAHAEARVHSMPVEKVHFHEVGAVDAIVDVVGSMIGFYHLGVRGFSSSPVNVGGGQVSCQHGLLPVPAPATVELLHGVPVYGQEQQCGELTTPTGAAILTALCGKFGPLPGMRVHQAGYGAGSRITSPRPNVLRLLLGDPAVEPSGDPLPLDAPVTVIEANLDDMSPQLVGRFFEKALEAGALDVTATPVQMKKNRLGVLLSVVCRGQDAARLQQLVFTETTTLGVRISVHDRVTLQRDEVEVKIPQGVVRIKIGRIGDKVVNAMPEYEDCRRVAEAAGIALKTVQSLAMHEYMSRWGQAWGAARMEVE